MYSDTVTLFNRVTAREGDTWYPIVLHNVDLNMDKAAVIAKYGAESADSAVLHVRYIPKNGKMYIGEREYLPPKVWESREEPETTITFTSGTDFDFFWAGDWGNEEPITLTGATEDFYTFLNRTKDNVFAISSVGGPYSLIPHFEILGR